MAGQASPSSPLRSGSDARLALEAAGALARRQLHKEWAGSAAGRWLLGQPRPEGFAGRPIDLRPTNPEVGRRILVGRFDLAGSSLELPPGEEPWDRPSPSRIFAVALHRFAWLPDLLAIGTEGAIEGLRLALEWRTHFGAWNDFAWASDILERRVFNLACGLAPIAVQASEIEAADLAADLARQARTLLAVAEGPARAAERACAAAVAGVALAGSPGQGLLDRALARLARALPETVEPDGSHASRCPQAALELLFDLQTLDSALAERGLAAPDAMARALDRLRGAVRFFTLSDGGLPAMQGGGGLSPALVSAARASESQGAVPPARNGYQRLDGRHLQVIVDAAPPSEDAWSVAACAQPAAIEVLVRGKRLIVGAAWSPDSPGPAAVRVVDGASTASLGDLACGEPMRGFPAAALGPRLVSAYRHVEVRRQESDTALLVEVSHDGWRDRFGLVHERRLYIDRRIDELRGEDRFTPVEGFDDPDAARRFIPFTVRFHLHPAVRASVAADRRSVLLRPPGDPAGWWLRNDAIEAAIEPSIHYVGGEAKRTSQIVLSGQLRQSTGSRLRWKLTAADAPVRPPS